VHSEQQGDSRVPADSGHWFYDKYIISYLSQLFDTKIFSTGVKSTFLKMCARNQKEFDGTKKKNLIGGWFVSLKPGRAQLNAHIVKVFSDGCDVRCVKPSREACKDSVGLAPFLEPSNNHFGQSKSDVSGQNW
jgi:hypothetical protein